MTCDPSLTVERRFDGYNVVMRAPAPKSYPLFPISFTSIIRCTRIHPFDHGSNIAVGELGGTLRHLRKACSVLN